MLRVSFFPRPRAAARRLQSTWSWCVEARHTARAVCRAATHQDQVLWSLLAAARGRGKKETLSICSCSKTLKGYKARNGAKDKYHKNFLAVVERLAAGKFVAWGGCVVD